MEMTAKPRDIRDRTFKFAVRVVGLCENLDAKPGVRRVLGRQLLRSGTSIGANIEEAQAGQSVPDFVSKCSIALKEARETGYWLRLLAATSQQHVQELTALQQEADEISRVIGSIVVKTKHKKN